MIQDEDVGNGVDASQGGNHEKADLAVSDVHSTIVLDEDVMEVRSPDTRAPRRTAADRTRELLEAARRYHQLGINVVTVGGNKRPNVASWEVHQQVRQTPETLGRLPFDRAYGIAGVCGAVSSDIACLDFDKVEDDRTAFLARSLERLGLPSDYQWAVETPSGAHIWLRLAGDLHALGGRGKLVGTTPGCHHVELRFEGHYAILPPSRRQDGGVYRFVNAGSIPDVTPAEIVLAAVLRIADWDEPRATREPRPARGALALARKTVTPEYVETAIQGELGKVRTAAEGHRNDSLFKAAAAIGSMLHLEVNADEVAERLFAAGQAAGLPDDEAASAIRSGLAKGAGSPRCLVLRAPDGVRSEPSRPPYPLHVLPRSIRTFVDEAAACVGCPPEMVAVPLFGYVAATIGRTRSIQVKPGYIKHPVFWFAIVGAPGSGKSPADGLARSFVEGLQAKAYVEWQTEHKEWVVEHELWKQQMKGKGSGKAMMGGESYHIDPEPEEPLLEHFYTTDSTIEALAPILAASAGVAIAHDEMVGWVKGMGAYNGAAARDRAQFLSLWAERSLKVDRRGRAPLLVEDPVAVIIGGVQPDVLVDLAGEADKRDGFIDRFLWSWPEHHPVPWTEDVVAAFTSAAVEIIFRRLRVSGGGTAPVVLSDEARVFWRQWYDANVRAIGSEIGVLAGIRAKADVHLARLALVLHVLTHDDPNAHAVSAATLRDAAELVDYHLAHAKAVVHRLEVAVNTPLTGRGSTLRQRIIARLQDHGGWVSVTDIGKDLGGHITAADRDAELDRLEDDGLLQRRIKAPGELGGRPAVQWRYYERTCELRDSDCAA